MTEGKKTKTIPAQITFIKTENGFVGGNKQSCEILEALPENVIISFEVDESGGSNKSELHNLHIKGASLKELSMDDYFMLAEKVTNSILDKTEIPKRFINDVWCGNSQNFQSLALILQGHLSVLRQAEADKRNGKSEMAPVLEKKLLSHSEVSYVVYQMLTTVLEKTEHNYLTELIGVLLDIDLAESRLLKNIDERQKAKWIMAQFPEFSTRQLAAEIGVNHTTISRWLKDPAFTKAIDSLRECLELKKQGKSVLGKGKKQED